MSKHSLAVLKITLVPPGGTYPVSLGPNPDQQGSVTEPDLYWVVEATGFALFQRRHVPLTSSRERPCSATPAHPASGWHILHIRRATAARQQLGGVRSVRRQVASVLLELLRAGPDEAAGALWIGVDGALDGGGPESLGDAIDGVSQGLATGPLGLVKGELLALAFGA